MKNGTFIPVTRVQSSPDVKSDGKARFGDNNPTPHAARNRRGQVHQRKPRAHRKLKERNTLKHEYTDDELAELKSIYDESGEAGLQIGEMRALRKAGLVKQDLPPEPEKPHEDTLADYQAISVPKPKPKPEPVKLESTNTNRNPEMRQAVYDTIASFCDSGHVPTIQKIADAMHKSKSTVANHVLALAKEGRISKDLETGRYRIASQTIEQEEPIMTVTVQGQKQEAKPEEPRIIIANALTGIFDAVSALQRTAFQANDKVVYQFATKLLTGELMDIKANYSKDVAK